MQDIGCGATESRIGCLCSISVNVLPHSKRLVIYRLVVATPRTPDAVSPRQCPTKNGLIPPSSRSKEVIVRTHFYAPSFRGFRLDTASPPAHPRSDVAVWQQRGSQYQRNVTKVAVGQHLDRNSNVCKIVMVRVILLVDKTSANLAI